MRWSILIPFIWVGVAEWYLGWRRTSVVFSPLRMVQHDPCPDRAARCVRPQRVVGAVEIVRFDCGSSSAIFRNRCCVFCASRSGGPNWWIAPALLVQSMVTIWLTNHRLSDVQHLVAIGVGLRGRAGDVSVDSLPSVRQRLESMGRTKRMTAPPPGPSRSPAAPVAVERVSHEGESVATPLGRRSGRAADSGVEDEATFARMDTWAVVSYHDAHTVSCRVDLDVDPATVGVNFTAFCTTFATASSSRLSSTDDDRRASVLCT